LGKELKKKVGNVEVGIVLGDITEVNSEAIVNPANTLMIMGGGVAKAIKSKGGVGIELEAKRKAPVPIGSAIITRGGNLKAKYVIHAPTVKFPGGSSSRENVSKAVEAALNIAEKHGVREVAFPSMGTGVGGLSYRDSAHEMLRVVKKYSRKLVHIHRIVIVLRSKKAFKEFKDICKLYFN